MCGVLRKDGVGWDIGRKAALRGSIVKSHPEKG